MAPQRQHAIPLFQEESHDMKQEIEVFDYAKEIVSAIPHGVLLTTKNGSKVNAMTIGWGYIRR